MSCGRVWEVEAVADGRLHGVELASFERHAAACTDCLVAREKLAALHGALRTLTAPSQTELAEQRLRRRVLRAANERLLTPRAPRLPLLAAACVVGGLGVLALARAVHDPVTSGARPEPALAAVPHADLAGTTAIELAPPLPLPAPSASSRHRPPPAVETFERGVASFRGGNFGLADEQLAAFARAAPDDPRCEDAAYLRAVARWRMGDRETATRLARDYLRAYPAGLRGADARRIVDGTAR